MSRKFTLLAVLTLSTALLAGGCASQRRLVDARTVAPAVVEPKVEPKKSELVQRGNSTQEGALKEEVVASGEIASGSLSTTPEVAVTDLGGKASLEIVYFGFDRHDLTSEARDAIGRNFARVKPGTRIMLEGHTDEIGSDDYNLSLGERRAQSVLKYLSGLGLSVEKLRTITYGLNRPADPAHTPEAHAKNRRVVFVVEK